jgi:hypothetical protein
MPVRPDYISHQERGQADGVNFGGSSCAIGAG